MSEGESELNPSMAVPPPLPSPLFQMPPLPVAAPVEVKIHPGFWRSVTLGLIFFGITIGLEIVVQLLKHFAKWEIDSVTALFVEQMVAWPVTFWVGLRWSKVSFREAFPLKVFPLRMVPALVVTCFGLALLLNAVAGLIPMPDFIKEAMMAVFGGSNKVMMFLAIVVVAPVAEELFFRGLVLRGYLGRYSTAMAVWASAILFALYHMNPWQAVVALPLGLLFAWLYLRTGSVLPGVVGHMTVNFTGVFLMEPLGGLFGFDAETMREMVEVPPQLIVVGAVATGVGGLVLWWQAREVPLEPGDGGEVAIVEA